MHACDKLEQSLAPKPNNESEQNQWFRDYCALLIRDSLEGDAAEQFYAPPLPALKRNIQRESAYDSKA